MLSQPTSGSFYCWKAPAIQALQSEKLHGLEMMSNPTCLRSCQTCPRTPPPSKVTLQVAEDGLNCQSAKSSLLPVKAKKKTSQDHHDSVRAWSILFLFVCFLVSVSNSEICSRGTAQSQALWMNRTCFYGAGSWQSHRRTKSLPAKDKLGGYSWFRIKDKILLHTGQ